ncbi:MAG: toprim domain-containing protein [Mangrovibacterium sp.]
MNCNQAKQIKIVDFLTNQGIEPTRIYGENAWYKSPIRDEKKPSFKVNLLKNSWFDLGTGTGGNILDLVMIMNSTGLTGALMILSKPELSRHSFSFSEKQKENTHKLEIKHLQPLQNMALVQYLEKRGISAKIAAMYVMEAYYKVKDKQYFALAFRNDKGGYELRNEYYKGGNSPKYVTTIPGNNSSVNIFEGFMDFLSAMVYYRTPKPANKTIILNSVSNLPFIEHLIIQTPRINLYLDNDEAGTETTEKIQALNPNTINYSKILYPDWKDFNEFITRR